MLDLLAHKVNWLRRNLSNGLLTSLSSHLHQLIAESCRHSSLPTSVQSSLELDVLYTFLRNRRWLETSTFTEILTDQLVSSYGLSNDIISKLIESLNDYFKQLDVNSASKPETDESFLRYLIFAQTRGEEAFSRSTGFGSVLYDKIASNQKLILEELDNADDTRAHFLSELDQMICSEIIEICELSPVETDQMLITFELTADVCFDKNTLSKVYELLQRICKQGVVKLSSTDFDKTEIEALEAAGLVQLTADKVFCNDKAFECTSRGFAESFWQIKDPEYFRLHEFDAKYQLAVVRHAPLDRLDELAERMRPFLPRMTPSIYLEIARVFPTNHALSLLSDTVNSDASDWHRRFACQGLARLESEHQCVRQILHKVAQSDDSELVKDSALEQLARSPQHESESGKSIA